MSKFPYKYLEYNNNRETQKPHIVGNKNNDISLVFKSIVLWIFSFIISFLPIVISSVNTVKTDLVTEVFSHYEILFTLMTLVLTAFCELIFMKSGKNKYIRVLVMFLQGVLIFWNTFLYYEMLNITENTYLSLYKSDFVKCTVIASTGISLLGLYIANRD